MTWAAGVELVFNSNNLTVANKYRTTIKSGWFETPPWRGSDLVVPEATGRTALTLYQDEQVLLCIVNVQGTSQTDVEANFATLLGYFSDGAVHTLTRNMPDGSTQKSNSTTKARNFVCVPNGDKVMVGTVEFHCLVPGFS